MIRAQKRFGQNFLFNTNILGYISDLCIGCKVVEIGLGQGYLTQLLIEKCHSVLGIEIDDQFTDILNSLKCDNFDWMLADALSVDWHVISAGKTMVGNLPYNIATKIILNLCKARAVRCIFVIQEEVAQSIAASVSTKAYTSLSVLLQSFYSVKMHMRIGPRNFCPVPKVQSRLIELNLKEQSVDFDNMSKILRHAFLCPRKIIRNTLLREFPQFLDYVDPIMRAENISVQTYQKLAALL